MGRVGLLPAKWAGLSRAARAGLVAAGVGAAALVAGTALDAAAGRAPSPVVWHDQVSDGTGPPPAAP